MRKAIKALAATATLLVLSHQALAQVTVPPQPAPGPFPSSAGNTANGGLMAILWTNTGSIVQYLGLQQSQITEPLMTPEGGLSLDFGTISGFSSVFGSGAGVQYMVVAAKAGSTGFNNNTLQTTGLGSPGTTNQGLQNGVRNVRDYIINAVNNVAGCNSVNPCSTTDATTAQYAGNLTGNLFTQLGFNQAGAIGTPLNFYDLTGIPTTSGGNAGTALVATQYQNSSGFGTWLLSQTGQLTYSIQGGGPVVPLPAAVWLLMSGLAGFATIGRRKKLAA